MSETTTELKIGDKVSFKSWNESKHYYSLDKTKIAGFSKVKGMDVIIEHPRGWHPREGEREVRVYNLNIKKTYIYTSSNQLKKL